MDLHVRPRHRDLDDGVEIAEMVRRFYAEVAQDDVLGPMFINVAHVDWPEHLAKLTAFWCRALLEQPGYDGNPYRAHCRIHDQRAFTTAHFERWLELFHEVVDLGWAGPKAEHAKRFARTVAFAHSARLIGAPVAFTPWEERCL
jgi:hemoglobin